MNDRSFLGSLSLWVSTAVLVAFMAREARRGPLTLERPSTVYSNGHPAQRRWVPFILFLGEVGARLPRGATVLLVQPPATDGWTLEYRRLLAEAELPDQNVVPVTAEQIEKRDSPMAPYAAAFGGELHTARYGLLQRFPGGGSLFVAR